MYGPEYDGPLKSLLKAGKTAEEIMSVAPFIEEIEAILGTLKLETAGLAPPTADDPSKAQEPDQSGPESMAMCNLTAEELALNSDGQLASYTDYAERFVRQFVKTIVDTDSASNLCDVFGSGASAFARVVLHSFKDHGTKCG